MFSSVGCQCGGTFAPSSPWKRIVKDSPLCVRRGVGSSPGSCIVPFGMWMVALDCRKISMIGFKHLGCGMKKSLVYLVVPGLLLCIISVQVLPQVDLPDAAFHRNTAPMVAKARVRAAPTALKSTIINIPVVDNLSTEVNNEQFLRSAAAIKRFLPVLLCCFLC
jgi:hypothetical protein